MCYSVWDGAYKKNLQQIGKSRPCSSGSRFPLLLEEWSFTICLMSYKCIKNVFSLSLNKTFPSFATDSIHF